MVFSHQIYILFPEDTSASFWQTPDQNPQPDKDRLLPFTEGWGPAGGRAWWSGGGAAQAHVKIPW